MMRVATIFLLTLLCSLRAMAQAPSEEEVISFQIPWCLAKIAEKADFDGVWLRSDGTYRLEIKNAARADALVVKYFNPGVINVESAIFSEGNNELGLTVVLRDEGYPGSTYELSYFSERGVLMGTYTRPGAAPAEAMFLKKK